MQERSIIQTSSGGKSFALSEEILNIWKSQIAPEYLRIGTAGRVHLPCSGASNDGFLKKDWKPTFLGYQEYLLNTFPSGAIKVVLSCTVTLGQLEFFFYIYPKILDAI